MPENCGVLNTVITEFSWRTRPSPLLKVFSVDAASRSRPPFELTETPLTGLPDALMVPPKDTMCDPDTTVRPVLRLLFASIVDAESLMNAFALVAICTPRALLLATTFAWANVIELPLTLIPNTRLNDAVSAPVTVAADPVSRSRP